MVDLKIINKFPDDFTFGVATSSYQLKEIVLENQG